MMQSIVTIPIPIEQVAWAIEQLSEYEQHRLLDLAPALKANAQKPESILVDQSQTSVTLDIPLIHVGQKKNEFSQHAQFLMALQLFETGQVSIGKAKELAGVDMLTFMNEASKRDIPVIDYDEEEIDRELDTISRLFLE